MTSPTPRSTAQGERLFGEGLENSEGMRALSLSQPWAELVVSGQKVIETRKWRTSFRGPFFIHAAKSIDMMAIDDFVYDAMILPTGALVGTASLLTVKEYATYQTFVEDAALHLVRLAPEEWTVRGRFGFFLTDIKRLPNPIPCRGMLNFFKPKPSSSGRPER